ncbi:biotin/lipoyl-binding protein, partial [Pseudomonadota bacterium]
MFKRNDTQHEYEFLPAVLEVQDSPPSPVGRIITWLVVALTIIAIIWASVGQVDIVATAQGKIVTAGKSKTIQPLEIGVVKHIYVQEGQTVKKGDPLVELDTTDSSADKARLESELRSARLETARQTILTNINFDNGKVSFDVSPMKNQEGVNEDVLAVQMHLLQSEVNEYHSRLDALNNQE